MPYSQKTERIFITSQLSKAAMTFGKWIFVKKTQNVCTNSIPVGHHWCWIRKGTFSCWEAGWCRKWMRSRMHWNQSVIRLKWKWTWLPSVKQCSTMCTSNIKNASTILLCMGSIGMPWRLLTASSCLILITTTTSRNYWANGWANWMSRIREDVILQEAGEMWPLIWACCSIGITRKKEWKSLR